MTKYVPWVRLVLGLLLAGSGVARGGTAEGPRGLWLLPRKDPQNTARADVPGTMRAAPKEVWRFGGGGNSFSYLVPVTVDGKEAYFGQVRSGLRLVGPDGRVIWERPKIGVSGVVEVGDYDRDAAPEALVTLGTTDTALVDVATGEVRWTWTAPEGASVGSHKVWRLGERTRLICFPQNAVRGVCIDLTARGDRRAVVWDRGYPDTFWQAFGPQIVLADMDNDGVDDVVLAGKPGYVAVIDAETGAVQFDVRYDIAGGDHAGRPYGLLHAVDMDGDGFRDVAMVSCQVEEYLSIVRNEGGKALRPVWSKFVEHDLPDDFREVRPNVTSVADVDGDGRRELVVGLFNVDGDGRWHTVVIDPMKGFAARKADLAGRYFWGCYDLDGDGRAEIVTSTETTRKPASVSTLHAVDGRTFRDLAAVEGAALETTGDGRLARDMGFMAIRATPILWRTEAGAAGLLLAKRDGNAVRELWGVRAGQSQFATLEVSPVSLSVARSQGEERLGRLDRAIGTDEAQEVRSASGPLVGIASGKRELVFTLANGTVMGGEPDLSASGEFKSSWTMTGEMPALWVGASGDRVVCAVRGEHLVLSRPGSGKPEVTVRLPHPVYRNTTTRSGPTVLPFGRGRPWVYVGLQTGVHTMAGVLYDGGGRRAWVDEKEGPYPRTAAAADLDGDGREELVVDNHGKHLIYDLAGRSRLIAHGWNETIPGRGDGAKYVVPIVGRFGARGEVRIVMSSGLQAIETLDGRGARLAKRDTASTYEFEWNGSAVGRVRAGDGWDVAMVTKAGVLHCIDAATCLTRWTFDLGCKATVPINVVSADIDGNGRDNFLVGLPDGSLVALDERDGKGAVLWKMAFDHGVRDMIVADVDGDDRAEVLVETDDGAVRVLK